MNLILIISNFYKTPDKIKSQNYQRRILTYIFHSKLSRFNNTTGRGVNSYLSNDFDERSFSPITRANLCENN